MYYNRIWHNCNVFLRKKQANSNVFLANSVIFQITFLSGFSNLPKHLIIDLITAFRAYISALVYITTAQTADHLMLLLRKIRD